MAAGAGPQGFIATWTPKDAGEVATEHARLAKMVAEGLKGKPEVVQWVKKRLALLAQMKASTAAAEL